MTLSADFGLGPFFRQGRITVSFVILFPLLFVLSLVYGFFVALRARFYQTGIFRSFRPESMVVSIGNITLGGSGKTPMVEFTAGLLLESGQKTAVLLRGYKRPCVKGPGNSGDYFRLGDEGSMLKENMPGLMVRAGVDRRIVAGKLEAEGFRGFLVLDDGFQHLRVRRDLDIVCIDATRPFGNGLLLPAGHLRENKSALKRADVFCLTRSNDTDSRGLSLLEGYLRRINPGALVLRAAHEPKYFYDLKIGTRFSIEFVRNAPSATLCGIARPDTFEKTLSGLGADIRAKYFFPDHHVFTAVEMLECCRDAVRKGAQAVITTQKDAQRLKKIVKETELGIDVLVLRIGIKMINGFEEFNDRLRALRAI